MEDQNNKSDAIAEGRRIYLGNLLYTVTPYDIEEVLNGSGFNNFEHIHISIDPVSARNPGYCFVDFSDRETAERALTELSATVAGRPLKVGPCEPKKPRAEWGRKRDDKPAFQRWGDWNTKSGDRRDSEQGPKAALDHFEDAIDNNTQSKRLWVGGLGRMMDQEHNQAEISEYFAGFKPTAIGKRITPRDITKTHSEFSHYVFVDFATTEDAQEALNGVNGKEIGEGNRLKVAFAGQPPKKLTDRNADIQFSKSQSERDWRSSDRNTRTERGANQEEKKTERTNEPSRGFAARDWRRRE